MFSTLSYAIYTIVNVLLSKVVLEGHLFKTPADFFTCAKPNMHAKLTLSCLNYFVGLAEFKIHSDMRFMYDQENMSPMGMGLNEYQPTTL